jgi:hypothetical protein
LTKKPNWTLTEKTKLDCDKKNAQLRVEEKKIKKEHCTAANPPQKPTHKAQRGGYAGVQPSETKTARFKKSRCAMSSTQSRVLSVFQLQSVLIPI